MQVTVFSQGGLEKETLINRVSSAFSLGLGKEGFEFAELPAYRVLDGPDLPQIVLALLRGTMDRPRTVTFKIEDGPSFDPLEVAIDGISRDDDAGLVWMIEGRSLVSTRYQGAACTICYNLEIRTGTLRFSTPD